MRQTSYATKSSELLAKLQKVKERLIPPFEIPITEKHSRGWLWLEDTFKKNLPNYGGIIPFGRFFPATGIWRVPLDSGFQFVKLGWYQKIVYWDWTNRKTYYANLFDCEDFALLFKVVCALYFRIKVPVMLDYSGMHGYNVLVEPDGSLCILEPQTDQILPITYRQGAYKLETGLILI